MSKLIIGCPVKNDLHSLKAMLRSLKDSTINYNKIVFVVGGGCNNETMKYLLSIEDFITEIHNVQSKTPLIAYNYLFNLAKRENSDLLLIQTDVLFPKLFNDDWLRRMQTVAENKTVGAVVPLNGGNYSGPDYINGMYWLGGWCTYIPNRTIEKIGGYDENFPNGYGVDIDWTYRIHLSGLKIVIIDYWVHHHMQNERTHDKDENTEQMKQESAKYFKEKWKL